jgi:hypothetical protein
MANNTPHKAYVAIITGPETVVRELELPRDTEEIISFLSKDQTDGSFCIRFSREDAIDGLELKLQKCLEQCLELYKSKIERIRYSLDSIARLRKQEAGGA